VFGCLTARLFLKIEVFKKAASVYYTIEACGAQKHLRTQICFTDRFVAKQLFSGIRLHNATSFQNVGAGRNTESLERILFDQKHCRTRSVDRPDY
jgi:hypothetical protein